MKIKLKKKLKYLIASFLHFRNECKFYFDINKFFKKLNVFFDKNSNSKNDNKVLIEAFFDNPGYWFSINLMITALSIKKENCIAIISNNNENNSTLIKRLKLLNIKNILVLENYYPSKTKFSNYKSISSQEDLLKFKFKINFSNDIIYDELCKLQRNSFVDIEDKDLHKTLKSFEEIILSAKNLIEVLEIKTLITSHNIGLYYGSLTNAAIMKKLKVFTLTIEANTLKFVQFTEKKYQHKFGSGPSKLSFENLSNRKKTIIQKLGQNYIFNRMNGSIKEVGAYFAYNKRKRIKINREYLKHKFGWNRNLPIITIFASNYIDFPRAHGLKTFLNFREFITDTIKELLKNKNIYVLLKSHPADEFYVKVKNTDPQFYINTFKSKNFKLVDLEWSNQNLIKLSDGIITSHGTIGIEATHLEKPVLCANIGWYGHIGFVLSTNNKERFFRFIKNKFWEINPKKILLNKKLSQQFAGWYYCNPCHNENYKVPDNFYGPKNFKTFTSWIQNNEIDLSREIIYLKKWVNSKSFSYHSWKIEKNNWLQK